MFIFIKNNMLSFEQFRELISNLIRLYKSGCILQSKGMYKNGFLVAVEKSIPVLLSQCYGNVIADEVINYIKEDTEYSLEEIYGLIDDNCKLISRDSAFTLWKLNESYPQNEMFSFFQKYIEDHE